MKVGTLGALPDALPADDRRMLERGYATFEPMTPYERVAVLGGLGQFHEREKERTKYLFWGTVVLIGGAIATFFIYSWVERRRLGKRLGPGPATEVRF